MVKLRLLVVAGSLVVFREELLYSWSGHFGQTSSFRRESAPRGLAYFFKGWGEESEPVLGLVGFVEPISKPAEGALRFSEEDSQP